MPPRDDTDWGTSDLSWSQRHPTAKKVLTLGAAAVGGFLTLRHFGPGIARATEGFLRKELPRGGKLHGFGKWLGMRFNNGELVLDATEASRLYKLRGDFVGAEGRSGKLANMATHQAGVQWFAGKFGTTAGQLSAEELKALGSYVHSSYRLSEGWSRSGEWKPLRDLFARTTPGTATHEAFESHMGELSLSWNKNRQVLLRGFDTGGFDTWFTSAYQRMTKQRWGIAQALGLKEAPLSRGAFEAVEPSSAGNLADMERLYGNKGRVDPRILAGKNGETVDLRATGKVLDLLGNRLADSFQIPLVPYLSSGIKPFKAFSYGTEGRFAQAINVARIGEYQPALQQDANALTSPVLFAGNSAYRLNNKYINPITGRSDSLDNVLQATTSLSARSMPLLHTEFQSIGDFDRLAPTSQEARVYGTMLGRGPAERQHLPGILGNIADMFDFGRQSGQSYFSKNISRLTKFNDPDWAGNLVRRIWEDPSEIAGVQAIDKVRALSNAFSKYGDIVEGTAVHSSLTKVVTDAFGAGAGFEGTDQLSRTLSGYRSLYAAGGTEEALRVRSSALSQMLKRDMEDILHPENAEALRKALAEETALRVLLPQNTATPLDAANTLFNKATRGTSQELMEAWLDGIGENRKSQAFVTSALLKQLGDDNAELAVAALRDETLGREVKKQLENGVYNHAFPWYAQNNTPPERFFDGSNFVAIPQARPITGVSIMDTMANAMENIRAQAAGRNNISEITSATVAKNGLFGTALYANAALSHFGLGLSSESLTSGPAAIGNLLLKRAAPLVLGSFYAGYIGWEARRFINGANADENGNAPSLFANARANLGMAGAWIGEHTGITALGKSLVDYVPGLDRWGTPRTVSEYKDYLREGYDPVRSGGGGLVDEFFHLRLLGRTPFYGGKISYWKPNWYAMDAADANFSETGLTRDEYYANSWLPTPRQPFAPINKLFHPYYWENVHEEDRPYPVTGDMFTGGGEMLAPVRAVGNALLGPIFKPTRVNEEVYNQLAEHNETITRAASGTKASVWSAIKQGRPISFAGISDNDMARKTWHAALNVYGNQLADTNFVQNPFAGSAYYTAPVNILGKTVIPGTITIPYNWSRDINVAGDKYRTRQEAIAGITAHEIGHALDGGFPHDYAKVGNRLAQIDKWQKQGRISEDVAQRYYENTAPERHANALSDSFMSRHSLDIINASNQGLYLPNPIHAIGQMFSTTQNYSRDESLEPAVGRNTPLGVLSIKRSPEHVYSQLASIHRNIRGRAITERLGLNDPYRRPQPDDLIGNDFEETGGLLGRAQDILYSARKYAGMNNVYTQAALEYLDIPQNTVAKLAPAHLGYGGRSEQGVTYINPFRNTQATWLPDRFLFGDTYSEVDGGEWRLPGKGYEKLHGVHLMSTRASALGKTETELMQSMQFLGSNFTKSQEDVMSEGTREHSRIQRIWKKLGILESEEQEVYNEQYDVSGHIDAILNTPEEGRFVAEIKTVNAKRFDQAMKRAFPEHVTQLNFYMHEAGVSKGQILYVNRDNPFQVASQAIDYDSSLFNSTMGKVQSARHRLMDRVRRGVIQRGDLYSPLQRFQILADVAPFSSETKAMSAQLSDSLEADSPDWKTFQQAKSRLQQQKELFDTTPYRFKRAEEAIHQSFTVDKILDANTFTTEEDPEHPVRLAGVRVTGGLTGKTKVGRGLVGRMNSMLREARKQFSMPTRFDINKALGDAEYATSDPVSTSQEKAQRKRWQKLEDGPIDRVGKVVGAFFDDPGMRQLTPEEALADVGIYHGAHLSAISDPEYAHDQLGTQRSVLFSFGHNLNRELLERGYAREDRHKGSPSEVYMYYSPFQRMLGRLGETFAHADTMFNNKLLKTRSALEEYERGELYGSCLLPGSLVRTKNGFIPIEKITTDELVLTHSGVWSKISNVIESNIVSVEEHTGETVTIELGRKEQHQTTTAGHHYLILRPTLCHKWFERNNALERNVLINRKNRSRPCLPDKRTNTCQGCSKPYYENYEVSWTKASEVSVGDYVCFPVGGNYKNSTTIDTTLLLSSRRTIVVDGIVYSTANENTNTIARNARGIPSTLALTPELYTLFGYYLAEGSIIRRGNKAAGIKFAFNITEDNYVEEIMECISNVFGGSVSVDRKNHGGSAQVVYYRNSLVGELFETLLGSVKTKHIDWLLLDANKECLAALAVAYFNGDGYGYKNATTVCEQLSFDVSECLRRIGVHSTIVCRTRGTGSCILSTGRIINSSGNVYNIELPLHGQYLLEEWAQGLVKHKAILRSEFWSDNEFCYVRVSAVTHGINTDTMVYDIVVDSDDHSFCTSVGIVHNSGGSWTHPWRDWVRPTLDATFAKNPIGAAVAGGLLAGAFWESPLRGNALSNLLQGKDKTRLGIMAAGAAVGFVGSIATKLFSGGTWVPSHRQKEWDFDEYIDTLKYVRNESDYRYYAERAQNEESFDVGDYVRGVAEHAAANKNTKRSLEYQKRILKLSGKGRTDEEIQSINSRLSRINDDVEMRALSPLAARAVAAHQAAIHTMYGLPEDATIGERLSVLPRKHRQLVSETMQYGTIEEKERLARELPTAEQRIIGHQLDRNLEVEDREALVDYFRNHFLPRENWAGWDTEQSLDPVIAKEVKRNGMNPQDVGPLFHQQYKAGLKHPLAIGPFDQPRTTNPDEIRNTLYQVLGPYVDNLTIDVTSTPRARHGDSRVRMHLRSSRIDDYEDQINRNA